MKLTYGLLAAMALAPLVPTATSAASAATAAPHLRAVDAGTSCKSWKITGKWLSVASNGYSDTFNIAQRGTHLSGTATIPADEAVNSGYSTGTLTGTLKGGAFNIVVIWAPRKSDGVRLHGKYTGRVVAGHVVKGLATDLTTKPTPAPGTWTGYGPTVCLKK